MKTVIITGGSKGIGAATAEYFAQKDYHTVICYNNSETEAQTLAQKLNFYGKSAVSIKADVTNVSEIESAVDLVMQNYGKIDVLINNAGIAEQKLFTDISDDDWNRMIDTNLGGVFRFTRAVLPHMIRAKSGSIVNISSIWGVVGSSCEVHYSAAKAGIIGLTKALAKEIGPSGIRVNCVAPGVVNTEMNQQLTEEDLSVLKNETPLEKIGQPRDIARTVYFLASDHSGFTTGQVLSPNGGLVI